MTDTRDMKLGGRVFAVPPLPLGVNRKVYPLCRSLSMKGALIDRVTAGADLIEAITEDDLDLLANISFPCAQLVEPALTREEFDLLPISPLQLFDAFYFVIRFQTGMWLPVDTSAAPDAGDGTGEDAGEASPPTSTSTGSSPA